MSATAEPTTLPTSVPPPPTSSAPPPPTSVVPSTTAAPTVPTTSIGPVQTSSARNTVIRTTPGATPTSSNGIPIPPISTISDSRFQLGTAGIVAIVVAGCAVLFGIIGFVVIRMRAKKKNQETILDLQQISLRNPKRTPSPAIVAVPPASGAVYDPKSGQYYAPSTAGSSQPLAYPVSQVSASSQPQYASYETEVTQQQYPQYVDEHGRPYTQEEIDQWQQQQQHQYVDEHGRPYTQEEIDQWNAQNAQYYQK